MDNDNARPHERTPGEDVTTGSKGPIDGESAYDVDKVDARIRDLRSALRHLGSGIGGWPDAAHGLRYNDLGVITDTPTQMPSLPLP